ncbi:hypothetical protein U1Q18_019131 [Sarracenia purpurea var. burkii]
MSQWQNPSYISSTVTPFRFRRLRGALGSKFSDSETMRAVLLRTGSTPVRPHSTVAASPSVFPSVHNSIVTKVSVSQSISLHLEVGHRRDSTPATGIRRALSDPDVIRSESIFTRLTGVGSRSFPATIPEGDYVSESVAGVGGSRSLILNGEGFDRRNYAGYCPDNKVPLEEMEFTGGGIGKGRSSGRGDGGDDWRAGTFSSGNADWSKIDAYYQEMLKSNPSNSLLLRNYGRFLHEVEGDVVRAEEYYARAILASPGDGEVLALYGKLIWETRRDEDRAKSYFDRAVHFSPDNCMVMGLYAHFMWEAEDEDDEEGGDGGWEREKDSSAAMVEAL